VNLSVVLNFYFLNRHMTDCLQTLTLHLNIFIFLNQFLNVSNLGMLPQEATVLQVEGSVINE